MIYRITNESNDYGLLRATSSDGLSWTYQEEVVSDGNNPFLWKDPRSGNWFLYYHDHGGDGNRIAYRTAATIADLNLATSYFLFNTSGSIASPCVFYKNNTYYLATETLNDTTWNVNVYCSENAYGPFLKCENWAILTNNDACNIPLILDDTLYFYYCELTDSGNDYWDIVLRTAGM